MKKYWPLLFLLFALTAPAAVEDACEREGGCFQITQKAWNRLITEIVFLHQKIQQMQKDQCA